MQVVVAVITIGWLAFWAGWLVAALGAKSSQRRRGGLGRLAGVGVALVVVSVYLIRLNIHGGHPIAGPLLGGIGLAVWAIGLALAIWARIYIGSNWGMPMSRREDPDLITTGPYRLIRHPIYTGIILGLIGTVLATSPRGLIAAVAVAAYFIYSATREERFLAERFPDTFPPYKARTKMLIPFVV